MPYCVNLNRLSQVRLTVCLLYILSISTIIHFFTFYGVYNYEHVAKDVILTEIYKAVNPNLKLDSTKPDCTYDPVIESTRSRSTTDVPEIYNEFQADGIVNGSFVPSNCNPLLSVAVLVTYRNRQNQLNVFLPYMHNFLRKQNIHYKIFLIEQQDEKAWNKGMLYNIGARIAAVEKFPCLILHDVDLLPLDDANLYACLKEPRHLSASIDKFRFVLPYDWLTGGVLAIRSDHYKMLNGFSNRFEMWGGEDDDFSKRILKYKFHILRFPREMSRYTMLVHRPEARNTKRRQIMAENIHSKTEADGLSSVRYESMQIKINRLFTLIGVKL